MLKDTLRHTHLPYCLDQLEDGRYVLLNRNYKPVGFITGSFVTYEDYPVAVRIKGLTPKRAAKIDCKGRENTTRLYLYDDATTPDSSPENAQAYFKRLSLLMSLKIADED